MIFIKEQSHQLVEPQNLLINFLMQLKKKATTTNILGSLNYIDHYVNHYSKLKKNLADVLFISKFQDDLLNQNFLLRINCKLAKEVLINYIKNWLLRKSLPDDKLY